MDYLAIIKKAYQITLKNKFLWIFGILAGGYGGLRTFNVGSPNYQTSSEDFSKAFPAFDWASFWANYGGLILTLLVILAILAIIMFILNVISQGALVGSVDKLSEGQKSNFKDGFRTGAHQFWRILGMSIIYLLMILASLIVLVGPIVISVINKLYIIAVIWGGLLFFVCLAFWILVGLIYPYSLRVIVLKTYGVWESIRDSLHFFRDHWKEVVVIYLLLLAIGLGFGIALVFGILIVGGILLALGLGIWLASPLVAVIYGFLAGLTFFIALVVISGGYNAFSSAALTLTYNHLVKNS